MMTDDILATWGILLLIIPVVGLLVSYWIIRLGVYHGMRMHTEWTQKLRR